MRGTGEIVIMRIDWVILSSLLLWYELIPPVLCVPAMTRVADEVPKLQDVEHHIVAEETQLETPAADQTQLEAPAADRKGKKVAKKILCEVHRSENETESVSEEETGPPKSVRCLGQSYSMSNEALCTYQTIKTCYPVCISNICKDICFYNKIQICKVP